jgi:hypothetical protein
MVITARIRLVFGEPSLVPMHFLRQLDARLPSDGHIRQQES